MNWNQVVKLPPELRSGRGQRAVTFLVPVAVVGVLIWLHHFRMAVFVAGVALAVGIAGAASASFRERLHRILVWLGTLVGRVLTTAVLAPFYFIVFVPASIILAIRGRDFLALSFDPMRLTYWDPVLRDPHRPLYNEPFAHEAPPARQVVSSCWRPLRMAWKGLVWVTALAASNFALGLMIGADTEPGADVDLLTWPAVEKLDWFAQYMTEHKQAALNFGYRPFVVFQTQDFAGRYINLKDGVRRSYAAPQLGPRKPIRVFFFGASAVWGWYQRDDHTIASEFARLAERHGVPVEVVNYGQSGYTSAQDTIKLSELCATGEVPDIAIFYGGVNDFMMEFFRPAGSSGPHHGMQNVMTDLFNGELSPWQIYRSFSAIHMLRHAVSPVRRPSLAVPEGGARHAMHWLNANHTLARHLGQSFGFEVFTFSQPWIGSLARPEEEPAVWRSESNRPWIDFIAAMYRETNGARSAEVIDISDALDHAPHPVMVDLAHTNEAGSLVIAQAIYRHLEPALIAASKKQRLALKTASHP